MRLFERWYEKNNLLPHASNNYIKIQSLLVMVFFFSVDWTKYYMKIEAAYRERNCKAAHK